MPAVPVVFVEADTGDGVRVAVETDVAAVVDAAVGAGVDADVVPFCIMVVVAV